jgi:hexosaminidase
MRNLLLLLTMFIFSSVQSQDINIIPKPKSLEVNVGSFTINQKTPIVVKNAVNMASAVFLRDYLKAYYGFNLKIKKSGSTGIILNTNEKAAAKDGYSLISNKKASIITGETNTGTFYGVQTLIQLFPVQKSKVLNIPAVTVNDAPDRTYRGLHLDVGRHFMPISFIKKYIDLIALHKMNYFHWHLTEDQGWRIDICWRLAQWHHHRALSRNRNRRYQNRRILYSGRSKRYSGLCCKTIHRSNPRN